MNVIAKARLFALAALAATGLAVSIASAQEILSSTLSTDLKYADTCFSRIYSSSHLRSHPRQVTTQIALAALDRPKGQVNLPPNVSEFLIGIRTRDTSIWKTKIAYCEFNSGNGPSMCQIESDGGSFRLTNRPDGTVLIRTTGAIRLGSEENLIEIGGDGSDDNTFILGGIGCRRAPPM